MCIVKVCIGKPQGSFMIITEVFNLLGIEREDFFTRLHAAFLMSNSACIKRDCLLCVDDCHSIPKQKQDKNNLFSSNHQLFHDFTKVGRYPFVMSSMLFYIEIRFILSAL